MNLSKKKQLAYRGNKIPSLKNTNLTLKVPESALQKQAEDYLDAFQIDYIRVPDNFFKWVKMKAPNYIQIAFFKIFGGIPDLQITAPINDKYNLCLMVELKSKVGRLHGKQIRNAKRQKWQISRSVDDTIRIIDEFRDEVVRLRCEEVTSIVQRDSSFPQVGDENG